VVFNRIGDDAVLIHMKTNQIFELNATGARFWELVQDGFTLDACRRELTQEFDVADAQAETEIDAMVEALLASKLLIRLGGRETVR
jgi:hypothetical protein